MANITNGVKQKDRKKDLWAHVAFADLYAYNPTVCTITTLSKKVIAQYMAPATGEKAPGMTKLPDGAMICGGERALPTVNVPIENWREAPIDDTPLEVIFSTMEIIDPYHIKGSPASQEQMLSRLQAYITLGLYPLVCEPAPERDCYDNFEKYDSVTHAHNLVGTIVDARVVEDPMENGRTHLMAIIMWDPEFTKDTTPELIASYAGHLMLRDMISTPEPWVSQDADPYFTNNGVPVYEYNLSVGVLATIQQCFMLNSYINEAVVTGNLPLDFVSHLLQNMHESAAMANDIKRDAVQTMSALRRQIDGEPPVAGPQLEPGVAYEDAAASDDFGHRLHLYDAEYDPEAWKDTDEDTLLL